jgi:hypothetical protein
MPFLQKRPLPCSPAALLLVLAACVSMTVSCKDRGQPPVAVEQSPYHDGTIYRINQDGCEIAWTVYTTDLNRGVVKHFSRCPLPLASQVPFLERVVNTVLTKDRNAQNIRTLFWGGLMPEQGPARLEMASRLALAAHRSPDWDARKGRPKNGDMNGSVRILANSVPIYPELKALFQGFNRTIAAASVEKVRVLKAKDLPFYAELKTQGVEDWEQLPFDAMVWFRLSPGNGP